MPDDAMIEVRLGRIVIQDAAEQQYIYLCERRGERGFPILIGSTEAREIARVVADEAPERPLTHQLCYQALQQLGATLTHVDIVDLRQNTFFAEMHLSGPQGPLALDARPSDAIALALRAGCRIRVAKKVMDLAASEPE